MIKFAEKLDNTERTELPELSNYKDIKPILKTTDSKVNDYWDSVFDDIGSNNEIVLSEDEIISEIFDRDETDFQFDFNLSDAELKSILDKFDLENWNGLSDTEKTTTIKEFANYLCDKFGIEEPPKLKFFEADENHCGAYNNQTNTMEINRNLFNDPKEVVNTVAHETRHAYQYQRACNGETKEDMLYAINFLNYVEPIQVDGKYINFTEYQNQLLEAEARAFANLFN